MSTQFKKPDLIIVKDGKGTRIPNDKFTLNIQLKGVNNYDALIIQKLIQTCDKLIVE